MNNESTEPKVVTSRLTVEETTRSVTMGKSGLYDLAGKGNSSLASFRALGRAQIRKYIGHGGASGEQDD
jgi:hypothetical protein